MMMYYIIEAENLCLSPSTRKWEAGVFKNLHSGEKKDAFFGDRFHEIRVDAM